MYFLKFIRVVVNEEWLNVFPKSEAVFHPETISDHSSRGGGFMIVSYCVQNALDISISGVCMLILFPKWMTLGTSLYMELRCFKVVCKLKA